MKYARMFLMTVFAASTVLAGAAAARAEENAIQGLQKSANESWGKLKAEVEVDRGTYTKVAGTKLERLDDQVKELKAKTPLKVKGDEWNQMLSQIEQKKTESDGRYKTLQAATDQKWKDARTDLDNSIKDVKDKIQDAAEKALPEKEAYEIKAQQRINELDYRAAKLEANLKNVPADQQGKIRDEINSLNAKKNEANQHLEAIKKDHTDNWKTQKDALEACLRR